MEVELRYVFLGKNKRYVTKIVENLAAISTQGLETYDDKLLEFSHLIYIWIRFSPVPFSEQGNNS